MADIKVSELTEATVANNADYLYLVQSGSSKKANVSTVVANSRIDARVNAAYLAHIADVSGLVPANGQVLTWNNVTETWEPQSGGGITGLAGVGASSGTGFVSNVQLSKALNSQFIGNVTLSYANVRNMTFTDNAVNFYNAFTGTSFYWYENALARDGYWAFNRNNNERAYITADGWPVADSAIGQNTIPTFKTANATYVVATALGTGQQVGNLSLRWANLNNSTFTDNALNFYNRWSGHSLAFAQPTGWDFISDSVTRGTISQSGYLLSQDTLLTGKQANSLYVVATAQGTGQQAGNLTLRWANLSNSVFTDNALNYYNAFSNISHYWVESSIGGDGYWAWERDSGFGKFPRAYVSVNGYPVDDATAGANTLVTAKYGNLNYLKNDGTSSLLQPGGWSANAYSLSANIFSFRTHDGGSHTGGKGAYFLNDISAGGFRYYWPASGTSSVGLGADGVHFGASLLEDPSGTSSQVYRGDGTIGAVPSDVNLKRAVTSSTVGLNFIKSLDVKSFEMRNSTVNESAGYGPKVIGFIAQDVYNAANNYVDMNPIISDSRGYLGIDVNQIVAALVNAVKTLSDEVDQLKNR